jgi:DNA end-binding protein Ku
MEDSGLAGIGKFVMRNRQYLGCLHVRNSVLTLEQLHFADEVDPPEKVLPAKLPKVDKRELELASQLIESFAGDWKPEKYNDTYTDALKAVVKQKQKGGDLHRVREREEEETPDLLEALRLSVERTRGGGRARRNGSGESEAGATKEELQDQARKLGIEGRSKMSKAQLAKAVASAE